MDIVYNIVYLIETFVGRVLQLLYWLCIDNMKERPFTMFGICALAVIIILLIEIHKTKQNDDPDLFADNSFTSVLFLIFFVIFVLGATVNLVSGAINLSKGYDKFKFDKEYALMQEHVKELTDETNVKTETIPVETTLETKLYNYTEQHPEFATLTKEIIDSLYKERYVHDSTQAMLRDSSQIKAYIIAHIMDGYTDRNVKIEFLGDSLTQKDTYILSNGLYNMFSNLNKDRINETKTIMVTNE